MTIAVRVKINQPSLLTDLILRKRKKKVGGLPNFFFFVNDIIKPSVNLHT